MRPHHPPKELIEQFANGDLEGLLSSIISCHIDQCSVCQIFLKQLEENFSNQYFIDVSKNEIQKSNNEEVWLQIYSQLNLPPEEKKPAEHQLSNHIFVSEHSFNLPQPLKKLDVKNIKWMSFGLGNKITKIAEENNRSLFLIYISFNETVPLHSHSGQEYSYVISGSFIANGIEFMTGDFSVSDKNVTHAPKATSQDGCLILSIIENRLNFFQGFLKLLNKPIWWLLNWRLK